MEQQTPKKDDVLDSYMENLLSEIIPQETSKNRMSVGLVKNAPEKYCLWNPHNYRLYLPFNKATFSEPKPRSKAWSLNIVNGNEYLVTNYLGCTIRVKKHQIEITNMINPRWYKIDLLREDLILPQFQSILEQKDTETIQVLKEFIKEFGGSSDCSILRRRSENKIMHEDSIDKLPERMTFRDTEVKKVYMEKNVEFSSPILAVNYLRNRCLESVSPEIVGSLNALSEQALKPLTEQIKLHLKVQRETLKTMRAIRADLGQARRYDRVKQIKNEWGW